MRVASQQRLATAGTAAGHCPGIAAFELGNAGIAKGLVAEAGEGFKALPVLRRQRGPQRAFRLPVEVENLQVLRPELVADVGQGRLGAERGGKTVGQVAGNAQGIFSGERPGRYAYKVELHGFGVARLPVVDAIEVGLQGLPCGGLVVQALNHQRRLITDAQAAEQGIGGQQLVAQHLGQFTAGQAAHDFHLEQSVLGMHVAEGAVQVCFVLRLQVRHAAGVIAHTDRGLQAGYRYLAVTLRQFAVHVPVTGTGGHGHYHGQKGQAALH
ncbi:hypothetical protein D3C79_596320 [compost metagenome]